MPIMQICDADCKTVLTADTLRVIGWGQKRIYGPKAFKDVEAYHKAIMKAAEVARAVYVKKQGEAAKAFHEKYPEGRLPDEPDEEAEDVA